MTCAFFITQVCFCTYFMTEIIMLLKPLHLWLLLITYDLALTECPLGYLHYEDYCYFFSTNVLDWYRAESSCHGHNAKLAEVYSREVSDWMTSEAKKLGGRGYWLGGRDDMVEGHWVWSSTDKPFNYTAWITGQPDNSGGDEDCLQLFAEYGMLWNDNSCLSPYYRFICQKPYPGSEKGESLVG